MNKRFKFFFTHLVISALIALLSIIIVFWVWYPAPLSQAVGVTKIFLMMLIIDVIIGPLFTLLVYKEGKKTLRFDLSVIILIQILAFTFGFYSITQGRPAWIAYNVDRFELVRKNEIIDQNIAQARPEYQQPSWLKPQFVAVEFVIDKQQRQSDMFAEVLSGISLAQRPERYAPLRQAKAQIQQHAQPLNALEQFNDVAQVQKMLVKYPAANSWVPLKANSVDMVVLLNQSGQVVKVVDLRPWS